MRQKKSLVQLDQLINFIFELFSLKYILRSSYQTLSRGLGQETIAEHSFMTAVIGYLLAKEMKADTEKVVLMCLFHDILETRIGDANFIHKHYQILMEDKALNDMTDKLPVNIQQEVRKLYKEEIEQKTLEARLMKEADILEQLFQEKHYFEIGNYQAKKWMEYSLRQLKFPFSKQIGKLVINANIHAWWDMLLNKSSIRQQKYKTLFKYILKDLLQDRVPKRGKI